jgi:mTERF domain-containing protein
MDNSLISGIQLRNVTNSCPNLVIWEGTPNQLENNQIAFCDNLGFTLSETQNILQLAPELFMEQDTQTIQDRFDIFHNDIGFSHKILVKFAPCLKSDLILVKTRLEFLKKLGRAQFEPNLPNFVSPNSLALIDDIDFSIQVANVPVSLYNQFQQTI